MSEYEEARKILPEQGMSRAKDILPFLPFGRTTLHEWSYDGRFPTPLKLSPTLVAWKNSDVLEWLEDPVDYIENRKGLTYTRIDPKDLED